MPINLPPPLNWQDFEELCCDLWSKLWSYPDVQRYGSSGQGQSGIDIVGRPNGGDKWAGVQCKLKKRGPLTRAEIQRVVDKALAFSPRLSELLIATTAGTDRKAQDVAIAITTQHLAQDIFPVVIVSWDDIRRHLDSYPELITKHYSGYAAAFQATPPGPAASASRREFWLREGSVEFSFLLEVYDLAAGNTANLIDMLKVGAELGLSPSETKKVAQHLSADGLVEHKRSKFRINLTAAGCQQIEIAQINLRRNSS